MAWRCILTACVVLLGGLSGFAADEKAGVAEPTFKLENLSFEGALQGWTVEYKAGAYATKPFSLTTEATDGRQALHLVATSGTVSVYQAIKKKKFAEKESWNMTYDLKFADPEDIDRFCVSYDYRRKKHEGMGHRPYPYTVGMEKLEGGWLRMKARLHFEGDYKVLRIGFRTNGNVLIDNLRLERVEKISADTLFFIDPYQITISRALEPKLAADAFYNGQLMRRAKIFNQYLADLGFSGEKKAKLNRMSFYLGLKRDEPLNKAYDEYEKSVANLYDIFARAFLTERLMWRGVSPMLTNDAKLILALEFDPAARKAGVSFKTFTGLADKAVKDSHAAARKRGLKWHSPPVTTPKPFRIRDDGRPNQMMFPVWDRGGFEVELCRPLKFGITHIYTGQGFRNPVLPDGRDTFSELDEGISFLKARGYDYVSMHTPVVGHGLKLGDIFYEKHKNNPDMFLKTRKGTVLSARRFYNWWQPEVRAQVDRILKHFCGKINEKDEIILLGTAGEIWCRDMGYSRPAVADFHKYLEKKYETIDKLNALWRSKYASFTKIMPYPKVYASGRNALQIESSEWLDKSFVEWLKFQYDTIKKYAPNKLVVSQHNQFAYSVDPTDYFGTVDIMAHHSSATSFLSACQTIRSMNRFEKKILGQYEPAICEAGRFKKRYGNERATSAGNAMDTYRKTAKGMLIQAKSGPYSTAYFAPAYMGNIWLDMVLNMTVIRYTATGMSVAVNNVKALESVFINSDKKVSKLLVLHGYTRIPMQALYELLVGRDYDYECLPPSYISRGTERLENYDVVMAPLRQSKDELLSPYMQAYVKGGGVLICLQGSRLVDRFGGPLKGRMNEELRKIYTGGKKALRTEKKDESAKYEPNFYRDEVVEYLDLKEKDIAGFRFGKGRVYAVRGRLFEPKNQSLRDKLIEILGSHTKRDAYSRNNSFELTLLENMRDTNKRYLCIINPSCDVPREDEVFVRGKYHMLSDINVPGGFAVAHTFTRGYTSFRTVLEPGGFSVIEMDKVK